MQTRRINTGWTRHRYGQQKTSTLFTTVGLLKYSSHSRTADYVYKTKKIMQCSMAKTINWTKW